MFLTTMEEQLDKGQVKKDRLNQAVRRERLKILVRVGLVIIVLVVIAGIGMWYSRRTSRNLPGVMYPDQGQEHVPLGEAHEYNSNPPTSGWHHGTPAEWGIYKEEIADQILLHNLEHGGVWISYKPDISGDVKEKLESFYEKYGRKIIVTPRSANDADIVLGAWTHLDKFSASEYSEERVEKFIKAFRNKGPEFVP